MRKTAFVTGGSHGIGRGIVHVLAEKGYDIALTYNNRLDDAMAVKEYVESLGRRCFILHAALNDTDVPESVTREAIRLLGRLDVMVCNAGVTRHYSILHVTNEEISDLFNLNYRAYLLCCKIAARHMVKEGIKGSIFFITSSRGDRAYPEDMLYGGFKAGIKRATESIALDLAPHGIRVNCLAPGMTLTNTVDEPIGTRFDRVIPLGRAGTPREVGEAAAFLASDAASYITGVTLRIDGGLVLPGIPESMPDTVNWINPEWTEKHHKRLMNEEDNHE